MIKNTCLMTLFFAFYSYSFSQITLIPDPFFETRLINDGIDSDGILNGQMLTADANAFSGLLSLSFSEINDLTGIEAFINITQLDVDWTNITNMDLTNNTLLTKIIATGCEFLTSINVTGLINLSEMYFENASLTSLDVTTNSGLTNLNIRYNSITSLDLSQNHLISIMNLKSNGLTFLDLRNGNQENFVYLDSDYNPDLSCILFDDASIIDRDLHTVWSIDNLTLCLVNSEAECSSCLNTLSVANTPEVTYNLYPNPTNGYLHILTKLPNAVVTISNINGKIILIENLTKNDNLIDVSGLSSGLYLARFTSENRVDTKKLMIK